MGVEDVALRAIGEEDLSFLQDLITDPADEGSFMWQGYRDPREWRRRWESSPNLINDAGGILLVTVAQERAGFVTWSREQWFGRPCWSLGIQLARGVRGQGIGTRAHQLIISYLFSQSLPDRIEAYTEIGNIAERRALEGSGFELEGILRHASFRGGEWHDGVLYSIIRDDARVPPGQVVDDTTRVIPS